MNAPDLRFVAEPTLLPWLVAEAVCGEAARWLASAVPRSLAPRLAARAVRFYAVNQPFARRRRASGNVGREWSRTFLRHWLASRLARQHRGGRDFGQNGRGHAAAGRCAERRGMKSWTVARAGV